jgi:hypothetical protein
MANSPRISARTGGIVDLNVTFYRNGVAEEPFAIRRIDIYEGSEKPENLIAQIPIVDPTDSAYPAPLGRVGTGSFVLSMDIPITFNAPAVYLDVWRFVGNDPGTGGDLNDETLWSSQCNKFWVFPDGFYLDDGLVVPRFGFEALDKTFKKPEIRSLEVGLMPLPLYDFDFNRIAPIIPQLKALITIQTENCEVLVDRDPCRIGVRQGSYRTNPFVVQYLLDTNNFLTGTYVYRITLLLPNGETRVSDDMRITVH